VPKIPGVERDFNRANQTLLDAELIYQIFRFPETQMAAMGSTWVGGAGST
jgi:hypothetical protein